MKFEQLKKYAPKESLPILEKWFEQREFILKIPKKRATKFGDFKANIYGGMPQISVNSDLNPYAFLITLTHEFAHLLIWEKCKGQVKAHGVEWKNEFRLLMHVLLQKDIFPKDIFVPLYQHMINPPASSARDVALIKALKKYDKESSVVYLSEISDGSRFSLNNKKIFIKGAKQRTRYLCEEVKTERKYLIHGVAEVELVTT